MPAEQIVKRHARTRRGCLTCRIRKKKCDCSRPSCTKCERLHVQCLGYASDRPDWLKGDSAKGYTQAIKCFLSEYPAAKAYEDPVPYLVLKTTPEVEQTLTRDPGRFNPVYFDPESASLRKWLPAAPPPSQSHRMAFPVLSNGEPSATQNLQVPSSHLSSPYPPPHTPSPQTPYTYPGGAQLPPYIYSAEAAQEMTWPYEPQGGLYLQTAPFVATQPMHGQLIPGITTPSLYDPESHAVHYVPGPISLARQDAHALSSCKAGYYEAWAPMNWLLY